MNSIDKEILRSCKNELEMSELSSPKTKNQMEAFMMSKINRLSSDAQSKFNIKMDELSSIVEDEAYYNEWKKFIQESLDEVEKPFGNHQSNGTEKFIRDFTQLQKDYQTLVKQSKSREEAYEAKIKELEDSIKSVNARASENIDNLNKRIETSKRIKIELEDSRKLSEVVVIESATRSQEHIIHCINNDIPIYITGPAGCGKSYDAELVARYLKLGEQVQYTGFRDGKVEQIIEEPQYFYPMNAVQQEYQIKGYMDANGYYHPTNFWKAFKFGGLLLLDELDSSIPEVLVILNFAIANHKFEFPDGKGTITAHRDFRVIATGNTNGMGSDELYTGRYQLDAASLNRFVQMKYDYDRDTEIAMISDENGNYDVNIIDQAHKLRNICESKKIPAIVSYRQIIAVDRLKKSGLTSAEAWNLALLNSLDNDTKDIIINSMGWINR